VFSDDQAGQPEGYDHERGDRDQPIERQRGGIEEHVVGARRGNAAARSGGARKEASGMLLAGPDGRVATGT
jgi:hypothetical protein